MAKMRDGLRDKADVSVNVVPLFSKIEDGTSIAEDFAARGVVGDNAKSELSVGDDKRKVLESKQAAAPKSEAAAAQRRFQLRKQRAATAREYEYAAGLAGKASYWRDPVGAFRDGPVGGNVDRYADPYVLAQQERLSDLPQTRPVGANGGEKTFEASMAHMEKLRQMAKEHETSALRVLEEENHMRQALLDSRAKEQGKAFLRSLGRVPSRMSAAAGANPRKTLDEIKLTYQTRENQIAMEALRHAGEARHLRSDYAQSLANAIAQKPVPSLYGKEAGTFATYKKEKHIATTNVYVDSLLSVQGLR